MGQAALNEFTHNLIKISDGDIATFSQQTEAFSRRITQNTDLPADALAEQPKPKDADANRA